MDSRLEIQESNLRASALSRKAVAFFIPQLKHGIAKSDTAILQNAILFFLQSAGLSLIVKFPGSHLARR
jgi:hypothetical protein